MKKAKWLFWLLALCMLAGCAAPAPAEPTAIRTAQQLRQMAQEAKPGDRYVLAADIDLAGEEWIPPADFQGHLDGAGKTIANLTVSQSVDGNLGLFGSVSGTVENLHLENAVMRLDADTQYAGLLAGCNRGQIQNCTVTGQIRGENSGCIGVLVGNNQGGRIGRGDRLLTATAGSSNPGDRAKGLSAIVTLDFPEERSRCLGIAGQSQDPEAVEEMFWQDATGSSTRLSSQQQQLRQTVVDKMYAMGTVRWTTSEEIRYTANDNRKSVHSNAFLPGRTYVGIPYSGCEGSYERFMTQMQPVTDQEGRYVTVLGLEDGVKTKDGAVSGFILQMGNDCAGAVIWAMAAGLPYSVEDLGAELISAPYMVPNKYNTANYGVLPAGGYQVIESDESRYNTGIDARDTRTIIQRNGGAEAMAEYYARAYRGDYLLCVAYSYDPETDSWKKTANHARMLAYEPMIVRDKNGSIDLERSYAVTHEQGDGLYDNRLENGEYEAYEGYNLKQTSWRTDYVYSLSLLMTKEGYNGAYLPGTGYGYVPVTVAAYAAQEPLAEFTCTETEQVILPNSGSFTGNYLMVSARMQILDEAGQTVYEKTAYLPYRTFPEFAQLQLAELFADAADGLISGQVYRETLQVTAANGQTRILVDNQIFTATERD